MDWWIHIVATSGKYNDSLIDIEKRWSVRQLVAAHQVLDVWEAVERSAAEKAAIRHKTKR